MMFISYQNIVRRILSECNIFCFVTKRTLSYRVSELELHRYNSVFFFFLIRVEFIIKEKTHTNSLRCFGVE